jgi:hypothetical protein
MITAQALGIPTRMVTNEAHAWVEVHNATVWKRIDLGGAGRGQLNASGEPHEPPPDPFAWPEGATRGEDLVNQGGVSSPSSRIGDAPPSASAAPPASASPTAAASADAPNANTAPLGSVSVAKADKNNRDERPPSTLTLDIGASRIERNQPFPVKGTVRAEGEPCGHLIVMLVLSEGKSGGRRIVIGSLPTDDGGRYSGTVSVPPSFPVGEYELTADTQGDARCGVGVSP